MDEAAWHGLAAGTLHSQGNGSIAIDDMITGQSSDVLLAFRRQHETTIASVSSGRDAAEAGKLPPDISAADATEDGDAFPVGSEPSGPAEEPPMQPVPCQ